MNKIKLYLIDYPAAYIQDAYHKVRMYIMNKCRDWIYKYDYWKILKQKISSPYYNCPISDLNVGVLCPVLVVSKILEKHFGIYNYLRLQIHGIDVDTQQPNEIVVNIRLHRPGYLIGRAGIDINTITDMLMVAFNKRVRINIVEIKYDVNDIKCNY